MSTSSEAQAVPTATDSVSFSPTYRYYVLGVLSLGFVCNTFDRTILGVLLEPIRFEFKLSDTQLGFLGGTAFAVFYAMMAVPLAMLSDRTNRRNVLAMCILGWSTMTALCGMAVNFGTLLAARIGTAIGEAGSTPPSHSLIADYFPLSRRGTALSIYALGAPIGAVLGNTWGGWGNELFGWRFTFIMAGLFGIPIALVALFTVKETPRGCSDKVARSVATGAAPPLSEVVAFFWRHKSFRHLCMAAALHAFVLYAAGTFNAAFFMRSHQMSSGAVGSWLALLAAVGAIGTFFGGFLSDKLSVRTRDRRWYLWLPGLGTVACVPFQFLAYLSPSLWVALPAFMMVAILAMTYFAPAAAMTQALATVRMRAVGVSILLLVQTLVGLGLGPFLIGMLSDQLSSFAGAHSLRYALVVGALFNVWSAVHYLCGARTLRDDLALTERLNAAARGSPA